VGTAHAPQSLGVNPLLALVAVAAACWSAWLDLAARIDGAAAALPLALVVGALTVPCCTGTPITRRVPLRPLSLLLLVYTIAVLLTPPIFAIAPAFLAVCRILHSAGQDDAPRAPFYGLVLLALPVLPTLEFYTAYPVRLAAIEASATLLRMNGLAVGVEGLALRFGNELIQFDAPCSGVRMLWTCAFLASALAYLYRFCARRYALALALAVLLAIAGNILRATSLFYVESGVLAFGDTAWLHEAVGVVAFAMTALGLFVLLKPRVRELVA
jgi:exosortase/archaeosortase family protein